MVSKATLARELTERYERLTQRSQPPLCFVGFDGFTDAIVRVVDQRLDVKRFEPLHTITDFGKRILTAAGKSCYLELVPLETRVGGNAPLFTQALIEGGHRVVFAGAIGQPGAIEPIFQPMARRCLRVVPLSPSGHTDALEFSDGRVLLGKIGSLAEVSYDALIAQLPENELTAYFDECDLFVSANWTMLPNTNALWKSLLQRILPHCSHRSLDNPRRLFVDLKDTAKRTASDVNEALQLLPLFQPAFQIILSLDHSEVQQIYHALVGSPPGPGPDQVAMMARAIRKAIGIDQVVVHTTRFALVASSEGSYNVEGIYCAEPKITTGSQDHFNAGYCNGLLYGLPIESSLLAGVATAAYYVRHAHSPTIADLTTFLDLWHMLGTYLDAKRS